MLSSEVIFAGRVLAIAVLTEGGESECREFIENLAQVTGRKIKAIMSKLADIGRLRNDQIFKKVDDKIWEIKYGNARVYCFFDESTVICTHGAYKAKRKRTSVEIQRARSLRSQYLATKEMRKKGTK